MNFRSRRGAIILVLLGTGFVFGLNTQPVKEQIKRVPGYTHVLLMYSGFRKGAVSPAEAGDGAPATSIMLDDPSALAQDAAGDYYLADRTRFIWKVAADGRARIVVGSGRRGVLREGTDALEAKLGAPQGLAFDSHNRLHFVDSMNHAVFRVDADGTLTRVAGNGRIGDRGDGGNATDASLYSPFDIRFDSIDNLYIVDSANNRIRKVDTNGIITTVAGTGIAGYSGDGGPAVSARLNEPFGAYLDSRDRLYIADSGNNVVRMVDEHGTIHTIVGTTRRGYQGDGGPAQEADLYSPQFLVVTDSGKIYVGDEHNNVIRVVSEDGKISTLVGGGSREFPDALTADDVIMDDPEALLVGPDGSLLIVDGGHRRVFRVRSNGDLEHFAGAI